MFLGREGVMLLTEDELEHHQRGIVVLVGVVTEVTMTDLQEVTKDVKLLPVAANDVCTLPVTGRFVSCAVTIWILFRGGIQDQLNRG